MEIELDQTRPHREGPRPNWYVVVLAILATVVVTTGVATYVERSGSRSGVAAPVPHKISLEWAGNGQVDYSAVWPRTGRPIPPETLWWESNSPALNETLAPGDRYEDPVAALLVVRAAPDGQVVCRIVVDGQAVDEQRIAAGLATTCAWDVA